MTYDHYEMLMGFAGLISGFLLFYAIFQRF